MLRRAYDWTMSLAGHRHALAALAVVAFAESSFFPVPPDVLIIPMVLAAPKRAWRIAAVATVASVAGGLFGYAIGALLHDTVGMPLLAFYGYEDKFAAFQGAYNDWGAWIVFTAGFSPIPYKIFTIASGVTGLSLPVFVIASAASRGARFFLVAGLLGYFGEPVRAFIEDNLPALALAFCVLLLGGVLAVRYLF